jgi:hypothetical protein
MNEISQNKVKTFEFKMCYITLVKSYMIHTFTSPKRCTINAYDFWG